MHRATRPFRVGAPSVAELAAGAVVLDPRRGEVLLIHHTVEDRWCFPKGHVDPGESTREAARREVAEETGLHRFRLGPEIAEVAYRFFDPAHGRNVFKTTVYYLAPTAERMPRLERLFDRFLWARPALARRRLPFATDRQVLSAVIRSGALRRGNRRSQK